LTLHVSKPFRQPVGRAAIPFVEGRALQGEYSRELEARLAPLRTRGGGASGIFVKISSRRRAGREIGQELALWTLKRPVYLVRIRSWQAIEALTPPCADHDRGWLYGERGAIRATGHSFIVTEEAGRRPFQPGRLQRQLAFYAAFSPRLKGRLIAESGKALTRRMHLAGRSTWDCYILPTFLLHLDPAGYARAVSKLSLIEPASFAQDQTCVCRARWRGKDSWPGCLLFALNVGLTRGDKLRLSTQRICAAPCAR